MAEPTGMDRAGWSWKSGALTYTRGPFNASLHTSEGEPSRWWVAVKLELPGYSVSYHGPEQIEPCDELGAQRYAEALAEDVVVSLGHGQNVVTIRCPECRYPWRRAASVIATAPELTEWYCPECHFPSAKSAWVQVMDGGAE